MTSDDELDVLLRRADNAMDDALGQIIDADRALAHVEGAVNRSSELLGSVLPVYLVCDTSASMAGEPIAALNDAIAQVYRLADHDPLLGEFIRVAVISFNSTAALVQPLEDLRREVPTLTAQGMSNYAGAFTLLHDAIARDLPLFKAEGVRVFRPTVFFLTDGAPTDRAADWDSAYERMMQLVARPNIVAFGFADADAEVLSRIATTAAFIAEDRTVPLQAISSYTGSLTQSIASSARSTDSAQALLVNSNIPGYVSLPL
ncbi:vWA domain-containing protein [Streptomyces lasiicapitis]|uniref:VWFA domain-containing protein n=1 Tax=Streptomyces lasiicapitis TaxID=1923961 RepID=A0ABQ2MTG5_9ACTN|nr:VWA domain-containing protein [Streptomyces lasiicapitis]GGO57805.1 hypothetical protein GCM10012286_75470 [Streptomyces lasiicapitis]